MDSDQFSVEPQRRHIGFRPEVGRPFQLGDFPEGAVDFHSIEIVAPFAPSVQKDQQRIFFVVVVILGFHHQVMGGDLLGDRFLKPLGRLFAHRPLSDTDSDIENGSSEPAKN